MSWPENKTAYHLIKLYDEGVVGFSAAALPYDRHEETWKITRPESGTVLTDDEQEHPCVLVKCWEIGDILQYLSIVRDLSQLKTLAPPPIFVQYSDLFWNYNTINNSLQVFTVREFFKLGTLQDNIAWMASTGNRYSLGLLDRWLIQLLVAVDWAHANGLVLMNLSTNNICVTDDGLDVRFVDYLPPGMMKEVVDCVTTPLKAPKDDHILMLFEPHKWTAVTDFESVGYLMLQLSLVGHPNYPKLKILAHPYSVKDNWSSLMEAVWGNHGSSWMQILDHLLGPEYSADRNLIMDQLLAKIRQTVTQAVPSVDWGSGTNVSAEQEPLQQHESIEQHNLPESSVLVSFLEQAWEFFQHDNQSDFVRICQSMLKLVPTDKQSAFSAHHLDIMETLLDKAGSDRNITHTLATVLAGVLYADDVDSVACATLFGTKLVRFIEAHIASADLICMLSTSLAQIPHAEKKSLDQRLVDLPVLYRAAFTHFQDWSTFVSILMCIIQEASHMPTISVAKTPLIPLLMLTLDSHLELPCEMHLCLRVLRRLIQTSDLGATMIIRFRVQNNVYSPVQTFVRLLERHGHKMSISREILLITVHLWSHARFFPILMEDNWLRVFAALLAVSNDKNASPMIRQCLSDRDLVVIDHKVFGMSKGRLFSYEEYFP